jgi:cytochrome c
MEHGRFSRGCSSAADSVPGGEALGRDGQRRDGHDGRRRRPNLKQLEADERVAKVAHRCGIYWVTTADGKTRDFWERNLRFKTDASADGPQHGAPAIVGAGMMGDRADVFVDLLEGNS